MSYRAQAWAIDVEETLPGKGIDKFEKFVLMMLAYCHNEEAGCAWCTQGWLARKTRMSKHGVINIIQRLRERGLIGVEQRATSSNLYTFPVLEAIREEAQPRQVSLPMAKEMSEQLELAKSEGQAKGEQVHRVHLPSEPGALTQVHRVHLPGERGAPNKYLSLNLQNRRPPMRRMDEASRRAQNNQAVVDAFKG